MSMVFDRYPAGGNERLLALALADHARDDGTRIWPSNAELARKTLQSERSVQRQIAQIVERGWLIPVRKATGRPGGTNEYRINESWIRGESLPERGDKLSPLAPVDNVVHTGDNLGERGDKSDERGDTAMSPESSGTIKNHIPPLPPVRTGGCGQVQSKLGQPDSDMRRKSRPPWRWVQSRSGIEAMGQELGVGRWDEAANQLGQGESFAAYERRVVAAAAHAGKALPPRVESGEGAHAD